MGYIHRLEVENFKSYYGFQTIGPFKNFTAVMGPNGAGKSNLMDAISFVVGVNSAQLRGDNLSDLIFNADDRRDVEKRKAMVKLVYIVAENELEGVDPNTEIHFSRQVSYNKTSTFRYQDKEVSRAVYNSRLKDIGVLVNAKNFLVFQGDVESIASKTPAQLSNFFEEISGSGELKEEYETLKAQKTEAETDTIFTYKQKKGITLEKKQAKEQKEEAERFKRKQRELEESKCEFFLWRLFHIRHEMNEHESAREELNDALKEFARKERVIDDQIAQKKQSAAKLLKSVTATEKAHKAARTNFDKQEPVSIKANESISHFQRKLSECEKATASIVASIEEQTNEISVLQGDIERLTNAEATLETRGREEEATVQSHTLTAAQLSELSEVKEKVRGKTVALRAELGTIEREQNFDAERREQLEHNQKQLQQRRKDLMTEQEGLQKRRTTMHAAIENLSQTVEEKQRELDAAEAADTELKAQRAELVKQLEGAKLKLRNVKAKRAENKKETKMKSVIDSMSRHFDGVFGRLVDVCEPTHSRYSLALSMAMGKHMDSVVVSSEATARNCIKYLRDQRAGVLTFLPLDTLQVKPTNDRWRNLGESFRLAIDVLKFEPSVERAIQYALGGVVVCDKLADARRLCFEMKEKVKAVTLQGDIISRNGDMTGGTTDADHQRASRFEEKELDAARRLRDRLEGEIAEVDRQIMFGRESIDETAAASGKRRSSNGGRRRDTTGGGKASFLQDLKMAVANATNRLKFATMDLEMTGKKTEKLEEEIAVIDKSLQAGVPEIEKLASMMEKRESQIAALKKQMKQVESKFYAQFEQKHGIEDVLESEQTALKRMQQHNEHLAKVREQRGKLEAQLHYVESRDLQKELRKSEKKVKDARNRLEKKKLEAEKASQALSEYQIKLEELQGKLKELKQEYEQVDLEIQELADKKDELVASKSEVVKSLAKHENELEKLRAKRHEELQQATLEKVQLPILENTRKSKDDASDSRASSSRRRQTRRSSKSNNDEEDDDMNEEEQLELEEEIQTNVDFSSLPVELQNVEDLSDKQVEKIRNSLQNKIASLQSEMEKAQPNMRADERYEDVSERLKETFDKLNKARESSKNAEFAFEEVKLKRAELFNKMFQHVERVIDKVYKDLTKSSRYPMGGNAYLTLDNTDEPFLGGIKYNAMPPNKRFRDMEQLSGGEKTVAALALLFAIHSFHPSPFFVMDEVDAALDNANVFKVSNYILNHKSDFQSIVISLKDTFYDKADALVGIYRERDLNCSKSLSLDLSVYN